MSDEEKKEYEELKSLLYTGTISQYGKRKLIEIIEKQSKEIEDINKENTRQHELIGNIHQKWKDKIKAKIEPRLKELDEQMKKEWKEYGNSREYQDMEDEWNFLQSLLEKE